MRPEFKDARERYYRAKEELQNAEQELVSLRNTTSWNQSIDSIPGQRAVLTAQQEKRAEACKAELSAAEQVYNAFTTKLPSRPVYKRLPRRYTVGLSVGPELGDKIEQQLEAGLALAELLRRALTMYFEAQDLKPVASEDAGDDPQF